MRRAVIALALALGACGGPPPETATLPPAAQQDPVTDPLRSAVLSSAFVFGQPASIAGRPDEAALALARLEFLAVEIATGPRRMDFDPLVPVLLRDGVAEARAAFGLRQDLPPQRVMDGLSATAVALRNEDRPAALAALAELTGPGLAEPALQRLAAMPHLPRAATATARAQQSMLRSDRGRRGPFVF